MPDIYAWRYAKHRQPDGWSAQCFATGETLQGADPGVDAPDWLKGILSAAKIGGYVIHPPAGYSLTEIVWFSVNPNKELESFTQFESSPNSRERMEFTRDRLMYGDSIRSINDRYGHLFKD